jgi:hypothetical protein
VFESNEPLLEEVLKDIDCGKTQLPDFQRQWVWDDVHIRELLASVTRSFPIGVVMLLSTDGDGHRFRPRPVEGVTKESVKPKYLILDGQQRLTSLYLSLFCQRAVKTQNEHKQQLERIYYLDMERAVSEEDMMEAITGVPADRVLREDFARSVKLDLSKPEYEYQLGFFPTNYLFNETLKFEWVTGYNAFHSHDPVKMKLREAFERKVWLPLQKYKIPVIELLEDTSKDAVCTVFEKVNTGGVPLTVFELLTATYAGDDFELRKDWEARALGPRPGGCLSEHKVLKEFDATDYLTSVTLLASYKRHLAQPDKPVSCKRKDILSLELYEYRDTADAVTDGLLRAVRFLTREKVYEARDLPYKTQLIPLSVVCAILGEKFENDRIHRLLARWFWCGVFGELYGAANETRYTMDVPDVLDWIGEKEEPRTIVAANFAPTRLLTMQSRLSAAYKGMMAKLMQSGSHDFITGEPIDVQYFFDQAIDIHHIFPRAYCVKSGISQRRCDSIVNKAPLASRTNRKLSGHAPSTYLKTIEKTEGVGITFLDSHISTHQIDPELLRADDFDAFFRDRAKKLLDIIEKAMGKTVSGRDSDETIEAFGGPLV